MAQGVMRGSSVGRAIVARYPAELDMLEPWTILPELSPTPQARKMDHILPHTHTHTHTHTTKRPRVLVRGRRRDALCLSGRDRLSQCTCKKQISHLLHRARCSASPRGAKARWRVSEGAHLSLVFVCVYLCVCDASHHRCIPFASTTNDSATLGVPRAGAGDGWAEPAARQAPAGVS